MSGIDDMILLLSINDDDDDVHKEDVGGGSASLYFDDDNNLPGISRRWRKGGRRQPSNVQVECDRLRREGIR